jgi:hypothetical protein
MYGIFTNIYHKNHPNVGKYTIHGAYGISTNLQLVFYVTRKTAKGFFLHDMSQAQKHREFDPTGSIEVQT